MIQGLRLASLRLPLATIFRACGASWFLLRACGASRFLLRACGASYFPLPRNAWILYDQYFLRVSNRSTHKRESLSATDWK